MRFCLVHRYLYCLDGKIDRPDPASKSQPEGVHRASEVIDDRGFRWGDANWRGLALEDYIIYEIHVGTYSSEGTFDAIVPHLVELKELGVTAIELMPVAQFPGDRNWGYDGVHPFAVQNSYGGPESLKRLVDAVPPSTDWRSCSMSSTTTWARKEITSLTLDLTTRINIDPLGGKL